MPVLLHCCGHFKTYLPDLAQTRISAIHPMQRTANMDLGWVKENYGSRFGLIGNIDSSRTLPFGTPEEVMAEAKLSTSRRRAAGISWPRPLADDGIPIENILALRQVGVEYGGSFTKLETFSLCSVVGAILAVAQGRREALPLR